MSRDRRPLIEGLKPSAPPVDPLAEKAFVFGKAVDAGKKTADRKAKAGLTTRIRPDFSAALKRASLTRQLEGVEPNTLQEIIEEALEPWLKQHGYLT